MIEFIQSTNTPSRENVLLDGRKVGTITADDGLFEAQLWQDNSRIALLQSYKTAELAREKVREFYGEGVFSSLCEIDIIV